MTRTQAPGKRGPFVVQAHTTSSPRGKQTTQTTVEDDMVSQHEVTIRIN